MSANAAHVAEARVTLSTRELCAIEDPKAFRDLCCARTRPGNVEARSPIPRLDLLGTKSSSGATRMLPGLFPPIEFAAVRDHLVPWMPSLYTEHSAMVISWCMFMAIMAATWRFLYVSSPRWRMGRPEAGSCSR